MPGDGLEVTFYTGFSKRANSTKQPTGTATVCKCFLKEPTSIEKPTLLLSGDHFNYTYAKINSWGRYYKVNELLSNNNGLTQVTLTEDYGASFKSAIGSTKAMILRASTGYNEWLQDDMIYVSAQKTYIREVGTNSVGFADSTGCYLLSVINEDGSATSFAAQYFMNDTGMQYLAGRLMDANFIDDIKKYFSNISNGIISLKWMPFDYNTIISDSNLVTLSNYKIANTDVGGAGYRITGNNIYIDGYTELTIPWRTDKDFREIAPYTMIKLLVPMYGLIDLNASDLVGASKLYVQYRFDRTTGDVILVINRDSAGQPIQTVEFNVSVEVPVATLTRNVGGMIASLSGGVNNAIGIAAGNYVGGTAGLIANGVNFMLSANGRSVSTKGSINGRAHTAYGDKFQMVLYVPHTADPTRADHINTVGRPLQAVDTIGSHSGYIQCSNASVDIDGLETERMAVNNLLNSGFYYE